MNGVYVDCAVIKGVEMGTGRGESPVHAGTLQMFTGHSGRGEGA